MCPRHRSTAGSIAARSRRSVRGGAVLGLLDALWLGPRLVALRLALRLLGRLRVGLRRVALRRLGLGGLPRRRLGGLQLITELGEQRVETRLDRRVAGVLRAEAEDRDDHPGRLWRGAEGAVPLAAQALVELGADREDPRQERPHRLGVL